MYKFFFMFLFVFIATFSYADVVKYSTPSGIAYDKLEPEIDSFVAKYLYKTTPGVAVIVTKNNDIIFSKGYGYANYEKKIPINPNTTVFEFGSITKIFVWLSAMQLVESGKLDLDKDIKEYLPKEFADKLKYSDTITMFDLMNHTAGFEDNFFDIAFKDESDYIPLNELLLIAEPKQIYKTGTTIAYSNYGASLAGFVIESISGMPFYQYVEKNIFKPVGIKDIVINPLAKNDNITNNLAVGYQADKKSKFKVSPYTNILTYPAGSARGTGADLAKLIIALNASNEDENKLTNNLSILDYMFAQSYTPNLKIASLSHGFWEYAGAVRGIGHGGNTASFSSNFYFFPSEKLGIIVLANTGNEFDLNYGLVTLLTGSEPKLFTEDDLPDAAILNGEYVLARKHESSIMSILNYAVPIKIRSISPNEIELRMNSQIAKLRQVSPYIFELVPSDAMIQKVMFSKIYAEVVNGEVVKISGGQISDLLPVSKYRTQGYMVFYFVALAVSILFFMIAPIFMMIRAIAHKFDQYDNLHAFLHLLLVLAGSALLVSNLFIFTLLDGLRKTFILHKLDLEPYLMSNRIIAAVGIVIAILGIFNWSKHQIAFKKSATYFLTVLIYFMFVAVLFIWNFI